MRQHGAGGHQEAWGAVAALQAAALHETLLQRVQLAAGAEAFDGGDVAPAHLHGQHQAGLHDFAVHQHGAGAADAGLAAALGAGQVQVVAQQV